MYADVEKLLIGYLAGAISPTARVGVATPADPQGTYSWMPFIRVQRVGGRRAQGLDYPRVVLEFFGPDYGSASDLGARVSALFDGPILSCRNAFGVVIGAQTDSAPSWVPYDDVRVARFQSLHSLVVHSLK